MPALVLFAAALFATNVSAAPPAANHPILGYWTFTVPGRGCSEASFFGPDGRVRVTSGDEVTQSEYRISAEPGADGFYEYRDQVTRSNGRKDCSGDSTPVGAASHWYVRFSADRNSYLMCQTATLKSCFGPVRRSGAVSS